MNNILLIDDDAAVTNHLKVFLMQTERFEGHVVNDSRQALEALSKGPVDAAILDMDMPNVSGLDILKEARDRGLDIPIIILTGNAQKIEQVVVNLLINAGQAMPEGRRGRIKAATRVEGPNVVIEVQDNGKGMSEQTIKRIFEPFFTTRRASGGTGLGLAIAYRIIEEHGGTIAVTSKLDVGTTFKISLPVKPASGGAKAPAEAV
jgi:signal transduction histidine kinase